jgi:hypothetical protein
MTTMPKKAAIQKKCEKDNRGNLKRKVFKKK